MALEQIDNLNEKVNWHWRNSMRVVRFLAFDGRAAAPFPLFLVYARLSTFLLIVFTLVLFRYLERKGLTVPSAIRSFRAWMCGSDRPGWVSVQKKKFIDYG